MAEPTRPRTRRWVHPFRDHPHLAPAFDQAVLQVAGQVERSRVAARLTVDQLADRAGLSAQGTISIRKAQSDLKLSTLVRLATALGHPIRLEVYPASSPL